MADKKRALEEGHVVEEFYIGHTHICICDDYCRDKTKEDVQEILRRIGRIAIGALTAQAMEAEGGGEAVTDN